MIRAAFRAWFQGPGFFTHCKEIFTMNKSTAIALAVTVAADIYTDTAWQMVRHLEQGTAQALEQAQ